MTISVLSILIALAAPPALAGDGPANAATDAATNAAANAATSSRPESATISGTIVRDGDWAQLRTANGSWLLVGADADVQAGLRKLHVGDLLVADVNLAGPRATVSCIVEVGLRSLLGAWRAATADIYEFADFHRLNQYASPWAAPAGAPTELASFDAPFNRWTYAIAPDVGARWSLLMAGSDGTRIGYLEFAEDGPDGGSDAVTIRLLQSETGQPANPIALSRLKK